MQTSRAGEHMQTSLRGIATKAKQNPKYRFRNLSNLMTEGNLRWCFPQLNRKAAPGVDAVDYAAFEADLDGNIAWIVNALKAGCYKAKLILRRFIPKPGGRRPLGIPVVGDKVVQTAVAFILSAIYEQDFLPCSHGYRRGKGPQRAALELSERHHRGRFGWVVDADIKGFLDPSSQCTAFHERSSNKLGCGLTTLILRPFLFPWRRWTASSSPRFTRCNTVWRETPSA